jgi:acetylornithine deacetylase/succinyl-diaminopimelate desuccinylase-like protein
MSLVDDLIALASIPAPTFAEGERIEWLEKRLGKLPGSRRRDRVGNLIWEWGEGRPRVLLAAHVDTVFDADTPLRFERDGSFLVGPGVGDNAAAVAVAVEVVGDLLREGQPAAGAVAFTVGEEGLGNLRGATAACEDLRPENFVALEGHMLDSLVVDAVGSLRARVEVTAAGGHSWSDRGSPSAIHELIRLAAELLALGTPEAPVNVGTIAGGRSVNAIADRAEIVIERRAIEQADLDRFAAALERLEAGAGCAVEVELLGRRPAGSLARDSELYAAASEVHAELGLETRPGAASTDANAAAALGVPALCIGVSRGSGMHSLSERIDLDTLPTGVAQLRALLARLLWQPTTPTSAATAA